MNSYYANDDVYNHLGAINTNASYNKTYTKVLPRAQFGVNIDENSYAYISYAKTFQVPGNRHQDSNSKNVSTQSVVNNLKPEVANTYNLGYRYTENSFYVTPGVYYSKYSDKIVSVPTQDPTVSNPQNVGSTSVYGLELESGVNITKSISAYGSYGYAKATYGNDYIYYDATSNTIKTVHVKSNQLVDTPEHTLSASLTYKKSGFEGTISGKYISSRYGDATNTQKVAGYTIINIFAKQDFTVMGAKLAASASVNNLFDTKYIGMIATGNTKGYYYAGTPLVATVGISGKF
ncbi:MAG TPA: TonB-dependent receptor [Arcobacter sp.]|nr:TonB-dependent receptor [Arcobacter sp.]